MVYVLEDVNWSQFLEALSNYKMGSLLVIFLVSLLPYPAMTWRLDFLSGYTVGFFNSLKASVFCLGINNLVPAKLGEVAKAFYLRRKVGMPLAQGLGMVFWERFFDLNFVLGLGLITAFQLKLGPVVIPLALVVVGIWTGILVVKFFPGTGDFLVKLVPVERIRLLLNDIMLQLRKPMGSRFFSILFLYTVLFWAANAVMFVMIMLWLASLPLTLSQALMVFIVSVLGFAVPSSPGALGVFEAVIVIALGWFGVSKEEALAAGLVMRFMTYVPQTFGALAIMAKSGLSLKGIRERDEESL